MNNTTPVSLFEDFKKNNESEALDIISQTLIEQCVAIHTLSNDPALFGKSSDELRGAFDDKKEGQVPVNDIVREALQVVKRESLAFLKYLHKVKLWLQLNIPKIEDGGNFGVSVQEDTINEISRIEDTCFDAIDSVSKYYSQRAKLVTKVLKYPNIQDYTQSIYEIDERYYEEQKQNILELRSSYALLYDLIQKNIEKIKNPRAHKNLMY
eukprot:TRINITY_DN4355_c0_g1_i2.p1 TRINITY_DN4355_c0_g1~~TRINITY_DN4355_c0_g1_i2.p1  ORF type:complete len:210 (+),score=60.89 TRINITY_DN4355_c0_g1_i2:25-654(+)